METDDVSTKTDLEGLPADAKPRGATDDSYRAGEDGLTRRDHEALSRWWQSTIAKGIKRRKPFVKAYKEAMRFCYESHDFMWDEIDPDARFKSTIPKVWEMVNIFGPMLAFRNPTRTARVRYPRPPQQDPQSGQPIPDPRILKTKAHQWMLNYQAEEMNLVDESREWVDQSIVAGMGTMWLEQDPTSKLVHHVFDDVMNLVIDPDADRLQDAWWIARKTLMPRWKFAEIVGLDNLQDTRLPRGNHPNILVNDEGEPDMTTDLDEVRGQSNEMVEVWRVWSKMGVGFRGREVDKDVVVTSKSKEKKFGDFVAFFIVPGSPYVWDADDWEVPLYADAPGNSWPVTVLYYRKKADDFWPVSILKAVLGQQKALDWLATMILNKIRTTSRDFIVTMKQLDQKVQEVIEHGFDLSIIKLDGFDLVDGKKIQDLISFLQHPPMNRDIWEVFSLFSEQFEKSSGLYSALYGRQADSQERSATAAELHNNRADLRPDDMRERVERAHMLMARKEAIAMTLLYDPEFVGKLLGPQAAEWWGEYQEGDLEATMREVDFTVEAESTGKRNLQKEREDFQHLFDRFIQVAMGYQDLNAINKLMELLQRAFNIDEGDRIQIQPPPPPPEQQQPREADTAQADEAAAGEKARGEKAKADEAEAKALMARAKAAAEALAAQGNVPNMEALFQGGGPIAVRNGQPVMPGAVGPGGSLTP